jgi:hypothetical protein
VSELQQETIIMLHQLDDQFLLAIRGASKEELEELARVFVSDPQRASELAAAHGRELLTQFRQKGLAGLQELRTPQEIVQIDPRKFSEYVFKPGDPSGKGAVFRQLGYSEGDVNPLTDMYRRQAMAKYKSQQYKLGLKDQYGQRIDIEIELQGVGAATGKTSYIRSGWLILADGSIKLNTPFSGYTR